jgi:ectoine hydroxylase-related dioxygenase (phytanoyl-CoA dioxygenase family)
MKNYLTDKNALSCPWVESPFFDDLLLNHENEYSPEERGLLNKFNKLGYLIIDLELSDEFIESLKNQINKKINENLVKQDERYEYNDSPRIFEAWKDCSNVLELCKHPKILETLKFLYGREPKAFQTINFIKGSNQPLHSDTIHFHTIPHKWMTGVWVALEDVSEKNGTLRYVPGSHKWDVYEFPDLNIPVPAYGDQFEAYSEYENS